MGKGPKDDKKDGVLNGFIRHLLTTFGGALVTKGYLGEAQLELTDSFRVTPPSLLRASAYS
jgi:hypothetical protein